MSRNDTNIIKLIEGQLQSKNKKYKKTLHKEFDKVYKTCKEKIRNTFVGENENLVNEIRKIQQEINNSISEACKVFNELSNSVEVLKGNMKMNKSKLESVIDKVEKYMKRRKEMERLVNEYLEIDTERIKKDLLS